MNHDVINIYTDGSARNNGYVNSSGGFGAVVVLFEDFGARDEDGVVEQVVQQSSKPTTNNREEMKAILWAMENYGKDPRGTPMVYSDSSYAVNTFTNWMWSWKERGWKKGNNTTPENLDLVQLYDRLYQQGYRIVLEKVRGHNGILWNEIADKLATGRMSEEEVIRKYG